MPEKKKLFERAAALTFERVRSVARDKERARRDTASAALIALGAPERLPGSKPRTGGNGFLSPGRKLSLIGDAVTSQA